MNVEPQKFYIGLIDFFSILLPGALLTYILKDDAGPIFLGDYYCELEGAEGWIVFLFSAYLLGHFIFLIGARVLDDPDGLLEGAGKYMRHVKIRPGREPDEIKLAALVKAAYLDMQQRLATASNR